MSTTLVSVGEYLAASFRPDRDYVDGELLERNMGEWDHSRLQALLLKHLLKYEDTAGLLTVPEQRVQVTPTRFRVPDLCVVNGNPEEQILTQPPLLVIEILSPEDSMTSMQERIADYVRFGVPNILVFDPRRRKAFRANETMVQEVIGVIEIENTPIRIALNLLWP